MAKKTSDRHQHGIVNGYRSGLEEQIAAELRERLIPVEFETTKIKFTQPAKERTYTADFRLPNGILIETKGRFVTADRKKHLLIKEQHPELDIRFVFTNPYARISKHSATTYAMWCEKNGFEYAKAATKAQDAKGVNSIPEEWLR